ncbi:MAG: ABC transporter ATP-binding protein [Candidatus Njordarchaeia archaeon]
MNDANAPMLKIENLSFKYTRSKEYVLKNINLELKAGEFVLLIGPSGCGKTTLINSINGLIPHVIRGVRKGKVYVDGVEVGDVDLKDLSTKVGTVFQDPETQFFTLTVLDELAFGPENIKLPPEEIEKRIDLAVKATGIENLLKKDIMSLSGGQKQRVAIASALTMMPKLLILDEPTTNLDPRGAVEVLKTIKKLRDETNMTIILIEHKLEEVSKYADRIIVMNEGEIIAEGHPREVYSNPQLLYQIGIRPPWGAETIIELRKLGLIGDGHPTPISPQEAGEILEKEIAELNAKIDQSELDFVREDLEHYERLKDAKPVIDIENLWHQYPDGTVALKGISLRIHEGEFIGIIGQNGAGKSTLLLHLIGLLRPSYGRIRVFGKDVTRMSISELSQRIGLIFQNPDLMLFQNTVWSEIAFGPKNIGLKKEQIEKRVREALEMMRLQGFEKRHPRALSRGQRHRVAVASILSMRPRIIIADEPTTGQDYGASKKYLELLERLNASGVTIILVSHSMDLIARYAKRVVVLKNGRVLLDGPTREVFAQEELLSTTDIHPPYMTQITKPLQKYGVPTILKLEELIELLVKIKGIEVKYEEKY